MNSVSNLLPALRKDFPNITFEAGEVFFWSPRENKITYTTHQSIADHGVWALLHEVAHAILGHANYDNDFELLKIESATWQKARSLGKKYSVIIDNEHIQDCLDTYRDWLHNCARCSNCGVVSLQRTDGIYQCFNCRKTWHTAKTALNHK